MNLRDLHYLVAVARLRSFSRAAEACHISQPTLSGQIRKLEEELGVRLFERTNKRVMLTPAGEPIVESAQRILSEEAMMRQHALAASDPLAGTFRLGAFPTVSTYILPPLVPRVREALPKLRLVLVEEKTARLLSALEEGTLDAAILALPVEGDLFESHTLFDDPFFLAVPTGHPLAEAQMVTHDEVARYPMLLLEEGHCLRDQALEVCQLHGLREEQDVRATGLETLRQMVRAGTGITMMPRIAMREGEEGMAYVPFAPPAPSRRVGLVWRRTTARQEAIRHFAELLRLPSISEASMRWIQYPDG